MKTCEVICKKCDRIVDTNSEYCKNCMIDEEICEVEKKWRYNVRRKITNLFRGMILLRIVDFMLMF